MSIMSVASTTSKLQKGIEASVDIQGANSAPAEFKDLTHYYSPAGMKPKGRVPEYIDKGLKKGIMVGIPIKGVESKYIKVYKYK